MGIFDKKDNFKGEDISKLKIGTKIEISKLNSESDFFHTSKLEEFISNQEIIILVPISKGALIKLPKNSKYTIIFKTTNGLFKNTMQIDDYLLKDGIPLLKIKLLEPTIKIQRRDCFRLSLKLDFKFDVVPENTEEIFLSEDPLLSKGRTEDISNGGIKFLSNEELEEGNIIKSLMILHGFFILTIGKILHKEETINNPFKFSYKLKFERIDNKSKEFISKYIFEEQRQSLKNKKPL